jgi:hypothetical protein
VEIGAQDYQMLMRAWGACTPNPCAWGEARVSTLASSVSSSDISAATAIYRQGFAVRRLTIHPGVGNTLSVEVLTHFTDNSGRSDYTETDNFRRVGWNQWDPNTYK